MLLHTLASSALLQHKPAPLFLSTSPLLKSRRIAREAVVRVTRRTWKQGLILMQRASPDNPGEEPPETLFMRELKRRGMSPTSNDEKSKSVSETSTKVDDNEGGSGSRGTQAKSSIPKGASGLFDGKSQVDQRQQSMALNSEGLEGLIPRAQALLSLGGSLFLAFWPLILSSLTVFAALYVYYGPIFIHSGPRVEERQRPYVDPYELLENERIPPEVGPSFVPYNVR